MKPAAEQQGSGGATIVSWGLIVLALGAFAPCLLLPEWRACQAVDAAEQTEQRRLDSLQKVVEGEQRLLEAMRDDPAVIFRLAQRELHFRHPGRQPVPVSTVLRQESQVEEVFHPTPLPLPPVVARIASFLPQYDYDAVFCSSQTRLVVMVMSLALMSLGLCLPLLRRTDPVECSDSH